MFIIDTSIKKIFAEKLSALLCYRKRAGHLITLPEATALPLCGWPVSLMAAALVKSWECLDWDVLIHSFSSVYLRRAPAETHGWGTAAATSLTAKRRGYDGVLRTINVTGTNLVQ